jgi:hypothetical protein
LFLFLRPPDFLAITDVPTQRPVQEHIAFAPLRDVPPMKAMPRIARAVPSARPISSSGRANRPLPLDTGSAQSAAPLTRTATPESGESFSQGPQSRLPPRLVPPGQQRVPWYEPPRARNPFATAPPLSAAERDSILGALDEAVPELAAHRTLPVSERDAAAKDAMLKMRLSGRTLLVPPDNTGGLIVFSIPVRWLLGDPAKARRVRDSRALEENRARLERLRQRADSMRRAKADSLPM